MDSFGNKGKMAAKIDYFEGRPFDVDPCFRRMHAAVYNDAFHSMHWPPL